MIALKIRINIINTLIIIILRAYIDVINYYCRSLLHLGLRYIAFEYDFKTISIIKVII